MKRLYNAICSLIEAKANQTREPEPELIDSATFTDHERSGNYEPDELHADQYRIGFTSTKNAQVGEPGQRRTAHAVPPMIVKQRPGPPPRGPRNAGIGNVKR